MIKSKHNPWFVHESIAYLENKIQPDWLCFEWGSGWSTLWLAELSGYVISVEHDKSWYDQVKGWLTQYNLSEKVQLNYIPLGANYPGYILGHPVNHFDLIEIDGRQRANCTKCAIGRLRPGGILIIDNSEREEYQEEINAAGVRKWECIDFHSGNSEGWTTSVYYKPI